MDFSMIDNFSFACGIVIGICFFIFANIVGCLFCWFSEYVYWRSSMKYFQRKYFERMGKDLLKK